VSLSEGQVGAIASPSAAGRYRRIAAIGAGGMGSVYRAVDEVLHRTVAVKVLTRPCDGTERRVRLLAEARAACALSHPNISTIFEVDDTDNEPCIVMEYVEGRALSTLIPPGEGLPPGTVLAYGVQIADALAHAHERGIVHRDLKSSNIIITPEQRAKVLDFGLAVQIPPSIEADTSTLDDAGSVPHTAAGTLHYMAPELLRGAPADPRADVWALGVVLYEMATGEKPFRGNTRYELSAAILDGRFGPLPASAPQALGTVIARCLTRDLSRRYRSAREVVAVLEALRNQQLQTPRPWTRRATIAGGVAVLLVAIAALAVFATKLLGPRPSAGTLMLAVVPVVPESTPDDVEALTLGIAEALTNDVARLELPNVQAMSTSTTSQYKRTTGDIVELVHDEVGATFVVMIQLRRQDNKVIVSAAVDDARDRSRKWGAAFPTSMGKDIFAVQKDIAAVIGENIKRWVTNESLTMADRRRLSPAPAVSEQAWLRYSQARMQWYTPNATAESYLRSLEFYDEALAIDRRFALAHIGKADTYLSMAWEGWMQPKQARRYSQAALDTAMAIDPTLGESHYTKASLGWWSGGSWRELEQEYLAGIHDVPAYVPNRRFYGLCLLLQQRFDEAISALTTARGLDPQGLGTNLALGTAYYWAKRPDEAIAQLKQTSTLDPTSSAPHEELADVLEAKGMYREAVRERQEALRRVAGGEGEAELLGREFAKLDYAAAMRKLYERELRQTLIRKLSGVYISPVHFAMLYIRLGKLDEAMDSLERALDEDAPWLFFLHVDPAFDPLRTAPRFAEIVKRVNMPHNEAAHRARFPVVSVDPPSVHTRNVIGTDPNFSWSPSARLSALSTR
jgi:eukaryotic-like serine/threonine-protein kinase